MDIWEDLILRDMDLIKKNIINFLRAIHNE